MNGNQRSMLFRLAKRDYSIERVVTADALIRQGYAYPVRIAIAPSKGKAVRITKAGRDYIRELTDEPLR